MSSSRRTAGWLEHQWFRTYRIADYAEAVISEPFAFTRDLLQNLMVDDGIVGFLPHWQRQSALHRFAAFIVDCLFADDCDGPRLLNLQPDDREPRWVLPVDAALMQHGLLDEPFFPPAALQRPDADVVAVQNAYYAYFLDLQVSALYETLRDRIAHEVFQVMFSNRTVLYALNSFLAMYVRDLGPETFEERDLAALFKQDGCLARKAPPEWARNAVFFREGGHCAQCGTDLSGLLSPTSVRHYDHIVALSQGGLNDVTNLQLLCGPCNSGKAATDREPSRRVQHWYRMPTEP